jgi:NAD(P)-dependent dehydrogenase (short-subunit alcohol dehydrogenase family)
MTGVLSGRTIIVTGASSGIGAAIARAAIRDDAQVMLHGRDELLLADMVGELGENAAFIACDLADPSAARMIVDATVRRFGQVDALVNNAGIFPRSTIDTEVMSQFDPVFHINVRAPLMLSQALIHHARAQKRPATIVNIGSINAYCGADMILIYSMSKGAMMTMTRNLADTHGAERVRVNQLNVGWTLTEGEIETQRQMGSPDDWHENIDKAGAPRGSLLLPHEVAEHAVFWLSDKSAPVNGAVYEVEQYPVIGRNRAAGK